MVTSASMYIDPATTTYIIQIATAVVVGAGTFFTIYWSKLKRAVKKKKEEEIEAISTDEINALHDGEKDVITADDLLADDDDDKE